MKKVDRVPVFGTIHIRRRMAHGFSNPAIIEKNIEGHKRLSGEVQPDFIKLMSDGYFAYPNPAIAKENASRIGDHSTTRTRPRLDKRAGGLS